MSRLKSSAPLIFVGLWVAVLSVEIGFLQWEQMRTRRSRAMLAQKKQERDRLQRQSPTPTEENEKAIAAALGEATRALTALRDELGKSLETESVPDGSAEAFFALNRLVDETRQKAADAHVALKPTERFGFASYANQGPPEAQRADVYRQCAAATGLIDALLEARPLELLSVKRESSGQIGPEKTMQAVDDYFSVPRSVSLRQPGLVNTDAFRLEFTGQTPVLRQFLNTLAGSTRAVAVRLVEVEPYWTNRSSAGHAQAAAEHLDRPQISKFTVTLEIPLIARVEAAP